MSKRNILVLEPFCEEHIAQIKKSAGDEFCINQLPIESDNIEIKNQMSKAEIIIGHPAIELLQNVKETAPFLRYIQMTWAGTDMYTRGKFKFPKDVIALANASGAYGMIISQYVIGLTLSLMLNFKGYNNQQNNKVWKRIGPIKSLDNAKVLIYGAGDIGTSIAKRLQGFDAYTIGVCRDVTKQRPYFDEVCTLAESDKYLCDADVVIGCIPNSDETCGFMSYDRMSKMKKEAVIVNVGRGNFIDCMALNELLSENRLWGAALDVTNPEPLPENHPLWDNPRCIITPHTSGVAFSHLGETEDLICEIVCDNIKKYIKGEQLINRVF